MKVKAFAFLIINYTISFTAARLLEKNLETTTLKIKAQRLPLVRVTRQIEEEESSASFSKEDNEENIDLAHLDRKTRLFMKLTEPTKTQFINKRFSRESRERLDVESKKVTENAPVSTKRRPVLVKKPTPNFRDIDDEENFQAKMYTGTVTAVKGTHSGEQADEDFNIDDYDFDVNHDEFSSRGKHKEPRQKHKVIRIDIIPEVKETTTSQPEIDSVTITKAVEPSRKIKKAAYQMKEDYYDDIATTKAPDKKLEVNDEESRESEYKEYDHKTTIKIESLLYPSYKSSKLSKRAVEGRDFKILPLFPVNMQSEAVVTTSPVDDVNYLRISIF